jgi:hypothetical protein
LREKRRLRVFEKRVLTRIFGPKRDEVTEKRRKLYAELNKEFLSTLLDIILVIKSRRMRGAEHVKRIGRGRVYTGFW